MSPQSRITTGLIARYGLPRGCLHVSHLSFANDIMIFTRANRRSIRGLMDFLTFYEQARAKRLICQRAIFSSLREVLELRQDMYPLLQVWIVSISQLVTWDASCSKAGPMSHISSLSLIRLTSILLDDRVSS